MLSAIAFARLAASVRALSFRPRLVESRLPAAPAAPGLPERPAAVPGNPANDAALGGRILSDFGADMAATATVAAESVITVAGAAGESLAGTGTGTSRLTAQSVNATDTAATPPTTYGHRALGGVASPTVAVAPVVEAVAGGSRDTLVRSPDERLTAEPGVRATRLAVRTSSARRYSSAVWLGVIVLIAIMSSSANAMTVS
jgi:hypothetical protein